MFSVRRSHAYKMKIKCYRFEAFNCSDEKKSNKKTRTVKILCFISLFSPFATKQAHRIPHMPSINFKSPNIEYAVAVLSLTANRQITIRNNLRL